MGSGRSHGRLIMSLDHTCSSLSVLAAAGQGPRDACEGAGDGRTHYRPPQPQARLQLVACLVGAAVKVSHANSTDANVCDGEAARRLTRSRMRERDMGWSIGHAGPSAKQRTPAPAQFRADVSSTSFFASPVRTRPTTRRRRSPSRANHPPLPRTAARSQTRVRSLPRPFRDIHARQCAERQRAPVAAFFHPLHSPSALSRCAASRPVLTWTCLRPSNTSFVHPTSPTAGP